MYNGRGGGSGGDGYGVNCHNRCLCTTLCSMYILLYLCHDYDLQQDVAHLLPFLELTLFFRHVFKPEGRRTLVNILGHVLPTPC